MIIEERVEHTDDFDVCANVHTFYKKVPTGGDSCFHNKQSLVGVRCECQWRSESESSSDRHTDNWSGKQSKTVFCQGLLSLTHYFRYGQVPSVAIATVQSRAVMHS